MNIGLVTIAAFLLLLPGVGFIVGVNLVDKNVREIVFRNTPAEIGYVVFISICVHLFIVSTIKVIWHFWGVARGFDVAQLYLDYVTLTKSGTPPPLGSAEDIAFWSLLYFVAAAVLGSLPGVALGLGVRRKSQWWNRFLVKHRWMLDLVQRDGEDTVFARIILRDGIPLPQTTPNPARGNNAVRGNVRFPITVEGVVRDCFFASDGSLLYIAFKTFTDITGNGGRSCLDRFMLASSADLIVIEGRDIAMARYNRVSMAAIGAALDQEERSSATR